MMRLDRLVTPWATRSPHSPAVEGEDETLSYGALDALANRFANMFRAQGVLPGDRVGIHVPRSGRAIAAMLGAMRAGAAYVPLDPSSPPARIALIAKDCGLRHVVIAPALLSSWVRAGVREPVEHFYLSADEDTLEVGSGAQIHFYAKLLEMHDGAPPVDDRSPDTLAYLLYTSGSTGVPKGVMLSHRNALSFVEWAADEIRLNERDRVASVAPFHFDLSVFDVWASLARGATIVIVDEGTVISGRRMLDRIRDQRISVWYSVPSALMLMLESGLRERGAASLRVVFFAGEVFPIKHLRATMQALPEARFYNLFGPTETNVCLACEVRELPAPDAQAIPIGLPACGDTCSILDEAGAPVPEGEIGELFVNGPTVMLGYWDEGRRTPAKRPYPTGDLVSRRKDGAFMYHGRRDHMVKVHGYRVELGEVESCMLAHPAIREAVATAIEQKLVVVAVCSDPEVSVLSLKQHCAARLPRYMVPAELRLVARLPRTSNGKVDRVRTRAALVAGDLELFSVPPAAAPRKEL